MDILNMSSSDDDDHLPVDLFQEPPGYFPPPPPHTFTSYTLTSGQVLNLRLVGHNPLWGHHIWNAAHSISAYMQTPSNSTRLIQQRSILELGAGAGLPSIVAALLGAARVVVTDYPDAELVANIQYNIDNCVSLPPSIVAVEGYAFGAPPERLLAHLDYSFCSSSSVNRGDDDDDDVGFDTLILADLLFNHHCHAQLLQTVQRTLSRTASARALVFFSPYRPWLLDADLAFFTLAAEGGFVVEKVGEDMAEKVMFRDDAGVSPSSGPRIRTRVQDVGFQDDKLRRTIFMYELSWKEEELR